MRTIPGLSEYIKPLENLIKEKFISNLLDSVITDQDRQLFSLPVKSGGLGIPILSEICNTHLEHSKKITAPLQSVIINQGTQLPDPKIVKNIMTEKIKDKEKSLKEKVLIIDQNLRPDTKKAVEDARLPGASSCLSFLLQNMASP